MTLLSPVGFETSQKVSVDSYGLGATLADPFGPILQFWMKGGYRLDKSLDPELKSDLTDLHL